MPITKVKRSQLLKYCWNQKLVLYEGDLKVLKREKGRKHIGIHRRAAKPIRHVQRKKGDQTKRSQDLKSRRDEVRVSVAWGKGGSQNRKA